MFLGQSTIAALETPNSEDACGCGTDSAKTTTAGSSPMDILPALPNANNLSSTPQST